MTEIEKVQRAQMYIEKLANGINPLSDAPVADDDLINNVRISRCLFYVSDILNQVIKNGGNVGAKKKKNIPLKITPEQVADFEFSARPITVSEITRRINEVCNDGTMKSLSSKYIFDFLVEAKMLQTSYKIDGKKEKLPTLVGESIGITTEERTSENGTKYNLVLYNIDAQHFIIDNIDAVIELANKCIENQGLPWTVEQITLLTELYKNNVPLPEIAIALKRTKGAVSSQLKKLGLLYKEN